MELANWRQYTRHPLSEVWGDMTEVEFEGLLADMKQHGYDQKQQVVIYEGEVLDGWHRQRAAVMCHKMPTYEVFKGTRDDAELFVIRRNLNRRHLDVSQRGLVAGRLTNVRLGGDRRSADFQRVNLPAETVAKEFGVSEKTVDFGRKVAKNGDESLQAAVAEKVISVSDAAAVANKPKAEQRKAVRAVRKGKAKTVRAALFYEKQPPVVVETMCCPLCKGDGRIPRKLQNDLFDAVVAITGADPKVSGSHVAKVCKLLLTGDPPYTPDEVSKLPAEFKKAGWKNVRVTVGMVEKYIGWVRNQNMNGSGLFDGIADFIRSHQ